MMTVQINRTIFMFLDYWLLMETLISGVQFQTVNSFSMAGYNSTVDIFIKYYNMLILLDVFKKRKGN